MDNQRVAEELLKVARELTSGELKRGDRIEINLKMSLKMDISPGIWEVERVSGNSVIIRYAGPERDFEGGDRRARYYLKDIEPYLGW